MQQPIGLIGVGLLGTAIAERLLKAGFRVLGFDSNHDRQAQFVERGGTLCQSASDVAADCRRLILSLPTSAVVKSVLDEIQLHLAPDCIVVDTTTGSPTDAQLAAQQLQSRGVWHLDATVAGSSEQLRQGEAILLIGGNSQAMDKCQDLWNALSNNLEPTSKSETFESKSKVFYLGPSGSGARMKLVVNLVLGLNRAALAEGLTLARRSGIDLQLALDVLKAGPAFSAAMETKGPKMIASDFRPQARLAQHHKDVLLILDLAQASETTLPLSNVHEQLLRRAITLGYGDEDNSAIIKVLSPET